MEKHCSNAKAAAAFLKEHPKVEWVKHPSLRGDNYFSLAKNICPRARAAC
ncbi:MAG: PLP-dependent transferase [Christensenellaceae bacterium]